MYYCDSVKSRVINRRLFQTCCPVNFALAGVTLCWRWKVVRSAEPVLPAYFPARPYRRAVRLGCSLLCYPRYFASGNGHQNVPLGQLSRFRDQPSVDWARTHFPGRFARGFKYGTSRGISIISNMAAIKHWLLCRPRAFDDLYDAGDWRDLPRAGLW